MPHRFAQQLAAWFTDQADRDRVQRWLTTTVARVHARAPRAWVLTVNPAFARLTVGVVEVLTLHPNRVRLLLRLDKLPATATLATTATEYGAIPYPQAAYETSPREVARDELVWQDAHAAYVDAALLTKGGKLRTSTPHRARMAPGFEAFVGVVATEPDDEPQSFREGEMTERYVSSPERNREARAACIAQKGTACMACGFDFEKTYGEIGKAYIHVHHVKALATLTEAHDVNPATDLVPVCANCHAMLHRDVKAPRTVEELQQRLARHGRK